MNLEDVADNIKRYDDVLTMFEFKEKGDGIKPWSIRHENKKGQVIEVRMSDWTLYEKEKETVGKNPNGLKRYLLKQLSKDELINLILW